LETAGLPEAAVWDRLEAFQAVSSDVARAKDPAEVADKALRLALELTGAAVAFIGLIDDAGNRQEVYSRSAEAGTSMTREQIDEMFAAAGKPSNPCLLYTSPSPRD